MAITLVVTYSETERV